MITSGLTITLRRRSKRSKRILHTTELLNKDPNWSTSHSTSLPFTSFYSWLLCVSQSSRWVTSSSYCQEWKMDQRCLIKETSIKIQLKINYKKKLRKSPNNSSKLPIISHKKNLKSLSNRRRIRFPRLQN